jgi:hypothetical protein
MPAMLDGNACGFISYQQDDCLGNSEASSHGTIDVGIHLPLTRRRFDSAPGYLEEVNVMCCELWLMGRIGALLQSRGLTGHSNTICGGEGAIERDSSKQMACVSEQQRLRHP